ncbi:MAG: hypothetical protein M1830_007275 [Pleopsidium flavum]|nr:MAG: hypothetical protein M1830_007275 [Pleopsidium flavum]
MASVFTYDPEPPRVSSPWSRSYTPVSRAREEDSASSSLAQYQVQSSETSTCAVLAECEITKLEAEPPAGPIEYKLHLLLRPRRIFSASSISQHVSGSHHSKPSHFSASDGLREVVPRKPSPIAAPSKQTRQNRLQHLTTQLLWRLQQSSPYHSSSTSNLILPTLAEATPRLGAPTRPAKLLPGLEESRGALYEIGVSDDGSFVGLTQDEMEESLTNLKAMAASLGCNVEVIRTVAVGNCEWIEEIQTHRGDLKNVRREKLWVAEALVLPNLESRKNNLINNGNLAMYSTAASATTPPQLNNDNSAPAVTDIESPTEQLRVSLTGSTTSGKSSLLGTLSTGTLDNGRGKSRLSLLKHRHEIASGITSSVAQELVGYRDVVSPGLRGRSVTEVINYASGNVSSWNDIHASSESGRLVFVSDSAGHPRYRRTTVRGLVSWAPHWTFCCIAANDNVPSNGEAGTMPSDEAILGGTTAATDQANAHLDLCLKLELPLVLVITKLDLASKAGLRQTLARVLSALKSAGRRPIMLPSSQSAKIHEEDLHFIPEKDDVEINRLLTAVSDGGFRHSVPIVLTSVVNGLGITKVHALLRQLPLPVPSEALLRDPANLQMGYGDPLFPIDEVFTMPSSQVLHPPEELENVIETGSIISGYLRNGEIAIGGKMLLGPFSVERRNEESPNLAIHRASSSPIPILEAAKVLRCRQRPSSGEFGDSSRRSGTMQPMDPQTEWLTVRVISIRNLRLPVHKLLEGQVGTIGVVPVKTNYTTANSLATSYATSQATPNKKIRKGMVLASFSGSNNPQVPSHHSGFTASFEDCNLSSLTVGTLVIIYIASIRASARVTCLKPVREATTDKLLETCLGDEVFNFDDSGSDNENAGGVDLPDNPSSTSPSKFEVQFQFVTYRECVEVGAQVLVMPAGGPGWCGGKGVGGLEGIVGRIVELVE